MVWKNTIAADHTEGEPPSRGSTILVNIGSIWNSSAALRKMAAMNAASNVSRDCTARLILTAAGRSVMVCFLVPVRNLVSRHHSGAGGRNGPGSAQPRAVVRPGHVE